MRFSFEDPPSSSAVNVNGGSSLITTNNCNVGPLDVSLDSSHFQPDKEDKKTDQAYKIINELLDTEEAYVKDLHLIDKIFREKVEKIVTEPEILKTIFANTSSIYSFHSEFLLPEVNL